MKGEIAKTIPHQGAHNAPRTPSCIVLKQILTKVLKNLDPPLSSVYNEVHFIIIAEQNHCLWERHQ